MANQPDATPEGPPGPAPRGASPQATPPPVPGWHPRARWGVALAGPLAGLLAFAVGEAIYQRIPPEQVVIPTSGTFVIGPTAATQAVADVRNAALAFGVLGGCLGGCLGIAGGLARRSPAAAAAAGAAGALLAAGLSAGASLPLLPRLISLTAMRPNYEIFISLLIHAIPWGLAGAAGGLAFALGLAQRRLVVGALAAGLVGAVLGAVAFDLIGAFAFPFADTGAPVSTTWQSRLLARLLVTTATAAVVSLSPPKTMVVAQ
jgi:hypothetical protein